MAVAEAASRVSAAAQALRQLIARLDADPSLAGQLYAPVETVSAAPNVVSLMECVRDGRRVRVPAALLAEGDVCYVMQGQRMPATARVFDPALPVSEWGRSLWRDDVFSVSGHDGRAGGNVDAAADTAKRTQQRDAHSPSGDQPVVVPCAMEHANRILICESPVYVMVRTVMANARGVRPTTVLEKQLAVVLGAVLGPIFISLVAAALLVNVVRYTVLTGNSVGSWMEMFFLLPAWVALPLLPVMLPAIWLLFSAFGNACILTLFEAEQQRCIDIVSAALGTDARPDTGNQLPADSAGQSIAEAIDGPSWISVHVQPPIVPSAVPGA